jgi:tripeptide aminopeptidase
VPEPLVADPSVARADEARVTQTFLDLVRIDSPTFKEGAIVRRLTADLEALGLVVENDGTGAGDCDAGVGNLIARLPGGTGLPIALSAHVDTVQPGEGIVPTVINGVVWSEGDTILGADDKAGVAAILEALRVIRDEGLPHPPLEVVLTWGEERAHLGAARLDVSKLDAKVCFIPDAEGEVGTIIGAAPTYVSISATFHGTAAHAGMKPEEGRSAIVAAARAIARTPLGRLDHETTCNVGLISGGTVRNAVPPRARVEAEARSLDDAKVERVVGDLRELWEAAAAESGCTVEIATKREYRAYRLAEDDDGPRLARVAARLAGVPYRSVATGGGSDANTLWEKGLPSVCLSAAMRKPHTRDEHVATADLKRLADLMLGLCAAARTAETG